MIKLMKIGASALAGSYLLCFFLLVLLISRWCVGEVTGEYTNGAGSGTYKALSNNGNPFGSKGNLSFSGSGETDWVLHHGLCLQQMLNLVFHLTA